MAFGLTVVTPALAQQAGSITGRVVHSGTLRPLAGVQISIPGSGMGSLANVDGRYSLVNVPAGSHLVRVQIIGYGTQERTVTVTAGQPTTADFEWAPCSGARSPTSSGP
jgi:hypothetical protein